MKYTATLTLALAAMVLATPMPAKKAGNGTGNTSGGAATGNAQQVSADINKWLQDIKNVNTFVDTAGSLTSNQAISQAAATAFVSAQDEGTQNNNLAKAVKLDSTGLAANKALVGQFNIIGPAINDTISNPQNLKKNLAAINGARCPPPAGNGAISQEGAVQQAAAQAVGITAAAPEIPTACGQATQAAGNAKGAN